MATNNDDPLALLANLISGVSKGAGQGYYQEPNTGARMFSLTQGGLGAAEGAGSALMATKEFNLKQQMIKQQMDIQERQMKIQEEQHSQQKAEFARSQEARNLELDRQARIDQQNMLASGYGASTTAPGTKYSGKMARNSDGSLKLDKNGQPIPEKTAEQLTHEWGMANQGKPLPQKDVLETKTVRKGPLDFLPFGAEKALARQFFGKDVTTTAAIPVNIVPGSDADGGFGKIDVRAIQDVDHLKRIGQAIQTDPRFTDADRMRLMPEWKAQMAKAAQDQFAATTAIKGTLDDAYNKKLITPEDYTRLMQLYGDMGARKNPELVYNAQRFLASAWKLDGQGMSAAFHDTMQSIFTRMDLLSNAQYRMGITSPAANYQASSAQLVQQGRPAYAAGKATKGKK